MTLNLFSISGILIIIATLPSILILSTFGRNKLAKLMNLELISILGWGIGSALIGLQSDPAVANNLWKITYSSVLIIPVFFLHLVYYITGKQPDLILRLAYIQVGVSIAFTLMGLMFPAAPIYVFDEFYYHGNSNFYLASFVMWLAVTCYSHGLLFIHYKKLLNTNSTLFRIFLLSLPLGFGGGTTNFLPPFGLEIYPFGNLLVPFYCILIVYAIVKVESFELKALDRGITYSLLLFLVSFVYMVAILYLDRSFQSILNYKSFYFSASIAFILGLVFVPLRYRIQSLLDSIVYKKSYEDLTEQNQKLLEQVTISEKYRTLATLASGIAHEIRNPLTIIKTFTEFLPKQHQDSDFVHKYARLTQKEVIRIENLVSQLMNYSKPNPPQFVRTPIKPLLIDSLDVLSNQLLSKKINLHLHLGIDEGLELNVDRNQLHQVILNIVQNAIEAMPEGGDLYVQALLEISPADRRLVLGFRDTGPGINHEQLKQIFDPFFTQKDFGTGLGLAIVQSIIENHHGKIIARSQVGEGTEMSIELPVS